MTQPFDFTTWIAAGGWQVLALIVVGALWAGSEMLYPRRVGRRIPAEDRGSSEAIAAAALVSLLAMVACFSLGIGRLPGPVAAWAIAGAVLSLAGTAIRYWAVLTLGQAFTSAVVVAPDQPVIEDGPYRWVRHPGYSGALMFGVGLGLLAANGAALATFLATYGPAMAYRLTVEERTLRQKLGPAYQAYAERVRWRLVPGLF